MSARHFRFFRRPRTANEKRHNAGFAAARFDEGVAIKGRIRGRKTGSRLADIRDDRVPASRRDYSRGKITHSPARKARALARDLLIA